MKQLIKYTLVGMHLLFWVIFLRHLPFFGSHLSLPDFDAYRVLWDAVLHGVNPYTVHSMQTFGPPIVILADAPFFLLPIGLSQVVFTLLNVISGYLVCWILSKRRALLFLVLSLLFWMTFPARFSLLMGQPGPLLALVVTIALTTTRVRALALGILITFKTNFVLALFSLLRRERAVLIRAVGCLALIGVLSLAVIKPAWYTYYFTHSFTGTLNGHVAGLDYYNQSLHSTLARIGLSSAYPILYGGLAALLMIAVLLSGSLELGLVVSLLLSPIVWQHYMVILFPVLYLLCTKLRGWKRWWVFACFVLMNVDIAAFHTMNAPLLVGIAASHVTIGLCGLTFLLVLPMINSAYAKASLVASSTSTANLGAPRSRPHHRSIG